MGNEIVVAENNYAIVEQVVISGDLGKLTPQQRVQYYNKVCESIGLNPFTRPFDYITLNGKLTLYAKKDATEQLRSLRGISITNLLKEFVDDLYIVTATATTRDGRIDQATGAVSVKGLNGEAKANAIMKAETKAKRRVTLSTAGLGWMDESEVDSVQGAQRVYVDSSTGEITGNTAPAAQHRTPQPATQSPTPQPAASTNGHKPATQPALDTSEMDAIGVNLYGEQWPTVRRHNIDRITKEQPGTLTAEQVKHLVKGMRDLQQRRDDGGHKPVTQTAPNVESLDDVSEAANNPFTDDNPLLIEARQIIAGNKLVSPPAAQKWAVIHEFVKDNGEAMGSWKKVNGVKVLTPATMPEAIESFVMHQLAKRQPMTDNAELAAQPELAA